MIPFFSTATHRPCPVTNEENGGASGNLPPCRTESHGARQPDPQRAPKRRWREHCAAVVLYLLLSIGATWPLISSFATAITGVDDAMHNVWVLWHTQEALLGRDPLFSTSLLYYPNGTTLLVNALGPFVGLFALPFWTWGPEAANNATILITFTLTGYSMYLLARGLGFDPTVSFLSGTVLLFAPIHVAALVGHMPKAFIGFPPLALLALHFALDPMRNKMWTLAVAITMLLTLLHSGEQFVFTALALGFFGFTSSALAKSNVRRQILQRTLLAAFFSLALAAPVLAAIFDVTRSSGIQTGRNLESFSYQPDLVQLFVPGWTSRFLGPSFAVFLTPYTQSGLETAVFLGWTVLLLCSFAVGSKRARPWLLFAFLSVLIALGPDLKIMGRDYRLPVIMPYAFLTSLPGMEFWRTPGRFMLVGFVAFGISSCFGLVHLRAKARPRLRPILSLGAILLVIVEGWPQPSPQFVLPTVPQFYKNIAQDTEQYGVFDIPIRPRREIDYWSWYVFQSSFYQIFQMTHGKGIASGYIDRAYDQHPFLSRVVSNSPNELPQHTGILVNGSLANRYADVEYDLARLGYRYVVYHKPQVSSPINQEGSWGDAASKLFIGQVFGARGPVFDDSQVAVYRVGTITDTAKTIVPTLALQESDADAWAEFSFDENWLFSPVTLYVASPKSEFAHLEITPTSFRDNCLNSNLDQVTATLQSENGIATKLDMMSAQTTVFPFQIPSGSQVVTLTVEAQNHPAYAGGKPCLGFAFATINLAIEQGHDPPAGPLSNGQSQ